MRRQEGKLIIPKILFEDSQLIVIDKPSGMVVNRAKSAKGKTVQDWVEENFKFPISQNSLLRNGIVHRIDKETSGVLVIAKNEKALGELRRQFKSREVEKIYVALVHGEVIPGEDVIKAPVGRLPWSRERFGVLAGGREAETRYKVIGVYQRNKEPYSLIEWYPKTGRTHQIRVHAKSINHPIVADSFYAGRKTSRRDRNWCPRLFLHAKSITFSHPKTGKKITVESNLPAELVSALEHTFLKP